MALFEPAFAYVMSHEDPGLTGKVTRDSGGVTRWGISQRAYPSLDIANLSLEDAAGIYRNDYFTPIHGFDIVSQRVASKLLDIAVNMGRVAAAKMLQRAVKIPVDGKIGAITLGAVNRSDAEALLAELVVHCEAQYYAIVQARPAYDKYLKGWLARARDLPA